MSFLKKMFGVRSAEELRDEALALFDRGDYGAAKLSFEKALEKSGGAPADVRAELRDHVDECCDAIAEGRIEEARRLLADGHEDLARAELEGAMETAVDRDVVKEARAVIEQLEAERAVEEAAAVDREMTDEERLAVIAGSWEEAQAEEYDEYGEPLTDALLALQDEDAQEALELLEGLLEEAEEARYLWLEIARARLLSDDLEGGEEALAEFIDALEPDEGGEARLAAHVQLARLADERDDFDAALEQYQAAVEALDGDPRPYLAMGNFLRLKELPEQAVEVLEMAASLMSQVRPDWRVLMELGLAQKEVGSDEEAMASLEAVVDIFATNEYLDFPPAPVVALAELCEKNDNLVRAADLYRRLCQGSDVANRAHYYREAGRLLAEVDQIDEARKMLQRGRALLADEDDDGRAAIDEQLTELDA